MKPKIILIVFGTRPEIIKLAPFIAALKKSHLNDQFIVASTSQHSDLLDEQLKYWKIIPDYFLTSVPQEGNLTRLLTSTLNGLQDIVDQVNTIEYIFVQGDTNTALASANLAFLNKIKLIHIEAGLRSYDFANPFPEEFNRVVTSRATYFHFAPTETSKNNLLNEGVDPTKILVTGNTIVDALYSLNIERNTNVIRDKVIITLHRRENIDDNYLILTNLVSELAHQHRHLNFIWVTHPNCINKIRSQVPASANMAILEHLPYNEFVELYKSARIVITDSGGVSEEAIHLGLPTMIFRKTTERMEAISSQYPMIVSLRKHELMSFFNEHINKTNTISYSYGEGIASLKILDWLKNEIDQATYDIVIIGGGPAGTGLLLKAMKDGPSNQLFNNRIALIEKTAHLIKGSLTQYKVNSDTFSDVFLECLEGDTGHFIDTAKLRNEIELLKGYKGRSIPLEILDNYFHLLGDLMKESLERNKKCDFIMNSFVRRVVQKENGNYEVFIVGKKSSLKAKKVIITTGGTPQNITKKEDLFYRDISIHDHQLKCVHSDTILKSGLPEYLKKELRKNPNIVILGGSHSAFSVAHSLINTADLCDFTAGGIKIWSSILPKVYFKTKEEALAHSYSDFTEDDICPTTKKVFRLAGLRMDGRELYMKMLGLGNFKKDAMVKLEVYKNQKSELRADLNTAAVIILAYGYKFNMIPFYNKLGQKIMFKGERTNHWVNDKCELLNENGDVIKNAFASGLATGFIPSGELGGEHSFEGQTNGIWYYQNAIADRIISNVSYEYTSSMP